VNTVNAFYLLKSRKISWNHPSERWTLPRVTQSPFIAKTMPMGRRYSKTSGRNHLLLKKKRLHPEFVNILVM